MRLRAQSSLGAAITKSIRQAIAAIACASLSTAGVAQRVAVARVEVGKPPFQEDRPRFNRFSGEEVMGVIGGSLVERAVTNSLIVTGLKPNDNLVCVDIEQSNGGYLASFEMPNPRKGASVEFVLPSRILRTLGVRVGELGILARATSGKSCAAGASLLRASWTMRRSPTVSLLINSKRADRTSAVVAGSKAVVCHKLVDELHDHGLNVSSFDTVCSVTLDGACAQDNVTTLQFRDGPSYRKPLIVSLRAPCTP